MYFSRIEKICRLNSIASSLPSPVVDAWGAGTNWGGADWVAGSTDGGAAAWAPLVDTWGEALSTASPSVGRSGEVVKILFGNSLCCDFMHIGTRVGICGQAYNFGTSAQWAREFIFWRNIGFIVANNFERNMMMRCKTSMTVIIHFCHSDRRGRGNEF